MDEQRLQEKEAVILIIAFEETDGGSLFKQSPVNTSNTLNKDKVERKSSEVNVTETLSKHYD